MARRFFSYWLLPVISAGMWVGTLLAMIIVWAAEGKPHYVSMAAGATVPYISDIGADILKPLFVTGCVITGLFFFFTLAAERYLRHHGRLVVNLHTSEKILSVLAIIGSLIGTAGLILLSIFDTKRHPSLHRAFLLVFMVGVIISAICTVIEYNRLMRLHRGNKRLAISYWSKLTFLVVEVCLAIAFGVCLESSSVKTGDVGGILEWVVAFVFTGYLLIFLFDLYPATKTAKGELKEVESEDGTRHLARQTSAIHGTANTY